MAAASLRPKDPFEMAKSHFPLISALSVAMPRRKFVTKKTVNVGFLAPLSGPLKSWAEPGFNGCLIWQERINASGGLLIGDHRYLINVIPYDTQFQPDRAFEGAMQRFGYATFALAYYHDLGTFEAYRRFLASGSSARAPPGPPPRARRCA